jgi:spermidine synthase
VVKPSRADADPPWLLYAIFAASGCAGLIYQVMWARAFGVVFGNTTRAAAVVLAAYFLGMALGNGLGGRSAQRSRSSALRRYAWIELGVALSGLAVLAWLALYRAHYPDLYRATLASPGTLTAIQWLLAAAALGPPCLGMGATLPFMARAVVAHEAHLGVRLTTVYALNTVGGVVGVLLSGFWLPVAVGVRGSSLCAAALNTIAALAAFRVASGLVESGTTPSPPPARPGVANGAGWLALLAAASGFGTLALEVAFTNLIVNASDGSVFSFALVLASFLVSLALGSALVPRLAARAGSAWTIVAVGAGLGSLATLLAPEICERVWGSAGASWSEGPFAAAVELVLIVAAVVVPAAICVGMVLPATWLAAAGAVETSGARVGRLTSWNTLAGVVGSLAAGFVMIPWLGVGGSMLCLAGLYAAIAALALAAGGARPRRGLALGALLAFASLAGLRTWQIVPVQLPDGFRLTALDESGGATIAIIENDRRARYLVMNSRYVLGGSNGVSVHRSQGELALALHGDARDVAFIGVATGMSVSAILDHPEVERAVAIELVPGVARLAREFREENRAVLDDPRVELRLGDGRNHLFGSDRRYDAIVGDLFVPWHAGTGTLYTVEHFTNVRERLRERGVFVQWIQPDQTSPEELRSIAASFLAAFGGAELWLNETQPRRRLLAFVGYRGRAGSDREELGALRRLCGTEVLRAWSAGAPRNTDDFPFIEFSAARSHLQPAVSRNREIVAAVDWLRAEERRRAVR